MPRTEVSFNGTTTDIDTTSANAINVNCGGTIGFGGTTATITTIITGHGVNIDSTTIGVGGVTFQSVDVNGTDIGINLDTITGTVNIQAGSITGTTGAAFRVNAGNANITYSGTINNTTGDAIAVIGTTGGTVLFNNGTPNAITDTGTGIFISGAVGNVNV